MKPAYYDTTYLLKLQMPESGSAEVLDHARTALEIHTAVHGRAEFASAAFRKVREGAATPSDFQRLLAQFHHDIHETNIVMLPYTDAVFERVESVLFSAPPNTYLRAADALHLATAAEYGFSEIYSNDKHLLTAAPLFGLLGVNVISF